MQRKLIFTLAVLVFLGLTLPMGVRTAPLEESAEVDPEYDVSSSTDGEDPFIEVEQVGSTIPIAVVGGAAAVPRKKTVSRCAKLFTQSKYNSFFNGNYPKYYKYILDAMIKAKWCTPEKMAAFLGTVKHETASMSIFYQPLDNGAGCLHMIPANWPFVFNALPDLRRALGHANAGLISSPTFDQPRFKIMTNPKYMFTVGSWWFKSGAGTILNRGCFGLETHMQNWVKSEESMTMLKNCVFGFAPDMGDVQRRGFIRQAYNLLTNRPGSANADDTDDLDYVVVVGNDGEKDVPLTTIAPSKPVTVTQDLPTFTILAPAPHNDGA